jgi:hypothetical protein
MGSLFVIDPDSSQFTIGAVLQQYFLDPDGKWRLHPIAFLSKKLTETESRYSAQEREMLAAKYSLDHWRHIVEGSEIVIRSDHQSLQAGNVGAPNCSLLAQAGAMPITPGSSAFQVHRLHLETFLQYSPNFCVFATCFDICRSRNGVQSLQSAESRKSFLHEDMTEPSHKNSVAQLSASSNIYPKLSPIEQLLHGTVGAPRRSLLRVEAGGTSQKSILQHNI